MGFDYLYNKSWKDLSREERYFCIDLFLQLKMNGTESQFINWLINYCNLLLAEEFNGKDYEIGIEVCYYRDLIFHYELPSAGRFDNKKLIKGFLKRTFDFCIFLPKDIIIIEAKAAKGMTSKQMKEFTIDKEAIKVCHKGLNLPQVNVHMIALVSQQYVSRPGFRRGEANVKMNFNEIITWDQIQECGCNYQMPIKLSTVYGETHDFPKRTKSLDERIIKELRLIKDLSSQND
ncbi:MAG: hypothetical protein WCP85_32015 [Mariniphaga sp.]